MRGSIQIETPLELDSCQACGVGLWTCRCEDEPLRIGIWERKEAQVIGQTETEGKEGQWSARPRRRGGEQSRAENGEAEECKAVEDERGKQRNGKNEIGRQQTVGQGRRSLDWDIPGIPGTGQ